MSLQIQDCDYVVEVHRQELKDGQSLQDFLGEVWRAVSRSRAHFGLTSTGSVWPVEVFTDSVVVRTEEPNEEGIFLRADLSRDDRGKITFGDPVVVEKAWREVGSLSDVQRSENSSVPNSSALTSLLSVRRESDLWAGVLGPPH